MAFPELSSASRKKNAAVVPVVHVGFVHVKTNVTV